VLIVHHLNNSRSQRILWLLEELAVPYEVKHYQRDPDTMLAPPALRAVHPLGKSPVITHGDRVVAETGAIVTYLVDNFGNGQLMPAGGTEDRLRYIYWLHFAEGSAMPPLVITLLLNEMAKRTPMLVRPVAKMIAAAVQKTYSGPTMAAQLDYIEQELTASLWFTGDSFSAADIMMSFPLEAASERIGLGTRTRTRDWLARIHDRPGYKAALQKGGPYAYAAARG